MSDYFIDDFMFITPLAHGPGIRLVGQVLRVHKIPLLLALMSCRRQDKDVTVDLTGVHYLSPSALEILVCAARGLPPDLCLTLWARPALGLQERLAARGWHEMESLRLSEA
ncbi:hypothetical protein [Streptomyces poonensis]|uniref:STAS domain-containing protein n=1 Tax=Streptomyces poonensis TaxID=68255 RepID=A0A918Q9H1_9ACTN|nr:hypothetical protein [Streptomyces poonensis]GGZ38133.1 hypothetical protein GCM10010365_68660 [Streptomyces poonensis]GLJ91074.1 hypothetical protein GCM10017589_36800 [Streptomyces poonensis]